MRERFKVRFITKEDKLWNDVIEFAENCSWRGGKSLARKMRAEIFKDYERIIISYDIEKNQIAGYCTFTKKDSIEDLNYCPYIGYVFIDEKYRGNRLSELMIQAVEEYAKNLNFTNIYIISGEIGLYEKYGFVKIEERIMDDNSIEQIFIKEI